MLDSIRLDVQSYLPQFHCADISVEHFLKSHIPELPVLLFFIFPLPARLEHTRVWLSDLYFQPLYVPILSDHLLPLHEHLMSVETALMLEDKYWTSG